MAVAIFTPGGTTLYGSITKRLLLLCCAALIGLGAAQDAPAAPPAQAQEAPAAQQSATLEAAGVWQGAIEIPGMPLEVTVRLGQEAQGWQGTVDIPAQGAADLPLGDITVQGNEVSFAMAGIPGDPVFRGTVEGARMTGIFAQAGQEFPFTLERQDAAAEAVPAPGPAAAADYQDPQGRFTVPIPTGWTAAEEDGYVHLASPEGGMNIFLLASDNAELEEAVAEGWRRVDPGFELEPSEVLEPPATSGIERNILVNYDAGDPEQIYQALAQLHDGVAYVMLIETDLATAQRRAAQLQIVATGFEITALEQTDLTGVEPRPISEVIGEFEPFVAEVLEAFGVPGASIAIVQGGEVVYGRGFGVREAGGTEPMTPGTHMMIGSTGKTMTSMLVATLVDDGIISWDTPVVEVMPEFAVADPQLTQEITFRNLLCACTGVPRRDFELFFNADELSAEAIVESLRTFEFFTDFGEAFQYSNQLVGTAGYAAAAADGAAFGNLFDGYAASLQRRVLDPIGMPHTTLSFAEVRERAEHATPHQLSYDSGEYEPIDLSFEELLVPIAPAGSHWSTAGDMARYLMTELRTGVAPNGERVVSEENLRETWEPQVPISATDSYGLGWIVSDYKGLEMFSHGGNTLGFTSEFAFLPDADFGIVVLTNAQAANAFAGVVVARLLELVYDQPAETVAQLEYQLDLYESTLQERRELVKEHVDAEEVAPYLGRFANDALGEIRFSMEGDQLVMDAGEFQSEIRPMLNRQGEFEAYVTYGVPIAGMPLEFELDDGGEPVVSLGAGAVLYRFERVE